MPKKIAKRERTFPERVNILTELVGGPEELAKRAKLSRRVIDKYRGKISDPSRGRLVAMARAAGVSIEWLATGLGPAQPGAPGPTLRPPAGPGMAVLGLAQCGLKGWYQEGRMAATTGRPGDLTDPDAFAVLAVGRSMQPAGIFDGFLCFCSPADAYGPGDAVFVRKRDGTASIKLFVEENDDWLTLKGYLAPEDEDGDGGGAGGGFDAGPQKSYFEQISRREIDCVATVIYVKRKL